MCKGDGCNKNWQKAGETGETTPSPSGGKKVGHIHSHAKLNKDFQCYHCSSLDGGECNDYVVGEKVTCEPPMDKGCFICRTEITSINNRTFINAASIEDIYIRDCGESTEGFCVDNEVRKI